MKPSNVIDINTTTIENKVRDLGYDDLPGNTDPRIRDAWAALTTSELVRDFRVRTKHDLSDLVSESHEYYPTFQPRANSTLAGDVNYYDEFYVLEKPQTQIPIATRINDELFMIFGWKRAKGHLKAISKGIESKFNFLEVIFDEDAEIYETLKFCSSLARLSNKRLDSVREDSSKDWVHQIQSEYNTMAKFVESVRQWDEEQQIEWGKQWAIDNISSDFAHSSKKRFLGEIVNKAFASHRGQSLPFPQQDEIDLNARRFFPNVDWTTDTGNVFKFECPTRIYRIEETLNNCWKNDLPASSVRIPCYATLRVGDNRTAPITSSETISKEIPKVVAKIAGINKHEAYKFAGYPIITKILFVKQMPQGDYRAFQWEEDSEEFVEVKEK